MFQAHGTTLTPRFVGDAQYYSNLDTGPKSQDLTELAEFWYQHRFLEGNLSVRVGRQNANEDFAYSDVARDFLNSSFETLPNIPMPFWPFQALGVSGLYQVDEKLRLGAGAYDHGRDKNQWWTATANRGLFFLGQADYRPFQDVADSLPTLVRAALWYTSSDTWAVNKSRDFEGNFGVYATLDRMLYREPGSDDQGLNAFLQLSWAPPDRNQVDWAYGGGVAYRGLLSGRDADILGAGFTLIAFSADERALTGRTYENAVELFYKMRTSVWSTLQPDLQYIAHPNGIYRDALVVGLRWEMSL
jgi:porin